jgi:hypothetical protein
VRPFLLSLACLVVVSCAVRQEVDLASDGSATVAVRVDLQPAFADWLASMAEDAKTLGVKQGSSGIFDEQAIRKGAASFAGVTVTRLAIPSRERLEMTLALADITALAGAQPADAGRRPLVTLERNGSRRTLRVYLDAANYARIKPLIPGADNQLFDSLGPQEKNPYTETEYDDVLAFTVGDDAPKWVRSSRIEVSVRVPGRIVSQKGGRVEGNTVRFEIPLLDALLLREPLSYAIEYDLGT